MCKINHQVQACASYTKNMRVWFLTTCHFWDHVLRLCFVSASLLARGDGHRLESKQLRGRESYNVTLWGTQVGRDSPGQHELLFKSYAICAQAFPKISGADTTCLIVSAFSVDSEHLVPEWWHDESDLVQFKSIYSYKMTGYTVYNSIQIM